MRVDARRLGGQLAAPHHFFDEAVVLGEPPKLPVAVEIAARVADVDQCQARLTRVSISTAAVSVVPIPRRARSSSPCR